MTATTRWEPCATILLQAALGPCSRGCSKGEEQSPGHSSQLHTPRTDAVREPVQRVLGTQRQPVLGYCPRGWEANVFLSPLGSFLIPLGYAGILSYTARMSWDPSPSSRVVWESFPIFLG